MKLFFIVFGKFDWNFDGVAGNDTWHSQERHARSIWSFADYRIFDYLVCGREYPFVVYALYIDDACAIMKRL